MILVLPRLHAVTDDRVIAAGNVVERAAAMATAGGPALAVQLRSRALEGGGFLALARELAAVIAPHGSWLVINGRADVARASGARAVVSGRGGLTVRDVRRVAPAALVARSVHDDAELRSAIAEGADFVMCSTGEGAHGSSVPSAIGHLPSIAIGGIRPENAARLIQAGHWGIAAIRALWDAPDPAAAVRAFQAELPRDETMELVINGESRRARRGISLAELLGDLGLDPRAVVVEHNRGIVRREALADSPVKGGDTIELVHFVGGG